MPTPVRSATDHFQSNYPSTTQVKSSGPEPQRKQLEQGLSPAASVRGFSGCMVKIVAYLGHRGESFRVH